MKQKMRDMFRTAYREGHDSVLLGAFGCGAFENDPELVAQLYKEVLSETEFAGLFKRVAFGIIDIGGTHNLETFERSFRGFRCEAPPAFLDLPPVYDEAPREPKRCAQKVLDSCAIL